MYLVNNFAGHNMIAFSVPPSAHVDLTEGFQKLSRIHFYLGRTPIDFMVEAVENASLQEIEKGKIQIYFATKEIQDFLFKSASHIDCFSKDSLNPSLYFQKTFDSTLSHTLNVLKKAFKSPKNKTNLETIETMLGLIHEVDFLSKELEKIGITTNIEKIIEIKEQYSKIYNLKSHYDNLEPLKHFEDYQENAKFSVLKQLQTPYNFNYSELAKHVYIDMDDWMPTLRQLSEEREKINESNYIFKLKESENLKSHFLKQFKSFNQLLHNGIVNNINSYSAAISQEVFFTLQKSQISAQHYFDREIGYHKKSLKHSNNDYHLQEIKKLEDTKEEFIKQKIDDKSFYEKYLTFLYRQENNISQSFDKIRANLFNLALKDTVTFEGDINSGFVIGKFSSTDQILLIHKDSFVEVPEAVYVMVISKNKYEDLVKQEKLLFNLEFRDSDFDKTSSFYSYGQFLQEISDPDIQNFFLGKEFDLIDNTFLNLKENKNKPKF